MKYEEAIKIIDAHDTQSDFWSTVRTAVEKQIPKKPIPSGYGKCNYCAKCQTPTTKRILIGYEKHCPDCGQAIDWSEVE